MRLASPIPHKRARIEIIPLIDIMFFLLASFMMVSLSQTHMKGIKVALPSATAVPPNTVKDYVSIRVGAGNTVSFDGQLVNDDDILRDCSDCTKQILESRFQLVAKVWRVMATSLPCSIKPDAPELRKSAIKFARPKVGPLLLPALLGLLLRPTALISNLAESFPQGRDCLSAVADFVF